MKRLLSVLLCSLLLMTLLTGCVEELSPYVPTGSGLYQPDMETVPGDTQPEGTELALAYYPDSSMNPFTATDVTNRALFSLMYQGLFTVNRNYEAVPILCSRYTVSLDLRVYTFYIEENVTFWDGTPLTPVDVVMSLHRAKSSPVYKGRFTHVYDLSKGDDGGVTVYLDTPCENFPLLLDIPIVKDTELDDPIPSGSGPYRFEQTASGARLRRVESWWCSAKLPVSASAIPLRAAQSPKQIRDDFEFSKLGLVCADPNSDQYADFRSDYELWDCENGNFLYLGCNLNSPAFGNGELRSALTYAVDRAALTEKYYHGFARSAALAASPQSPFYSGALAEHYAYDPYRFAQAVQSVKPLLTDEWGQEYTVQLLVNSGDPLRVQVARDIQKMLQAGGLDVELDAQPYEDYMKTLEKGKYDLYLGQTRLSPTMDLTAFFAPDGSMNYGGMADATIYSLCLDALANRGNFYNLHTAIAEDGRLCPILFQSYAVFANRGLVSGLTPARDAVFYYDLGKTDVDVKE